MIAAWRYRVWNRRVDAARAELNTAVDAGDTVAEKRAESAVTVAMARRTKWARRSGR